MEISQIYQWKLLSPENQHKIAQICESNIYNANYSSWCSLLNLIPSNILHSLQINWTNILPNEIQQYHKMQHPFNEFHQNKSIDTKFQVINTNSPCYDAYWCQPHSSAYVFDLYFALLGILGIILSLFGLAGCLLFIPVFHMTGITGSSSVFLVAISLVDILWIFLYNIMTGSLYLMSKPAHQIFMYQNFQAYLVPIMWPIKQFLDALTLWFLVLFLIDRVTHYLHRSKFNISNILNLSKTVKKCLLIAGVIGLVNGIKCGRYRVIDALPQFANKTMETSDYEISHSRVILTIWGSSKTFTTYLFICMGFTDIILPLALLLFLLTFLLVKYSQTPYSEADNDVTKPIIQGCGGSDPPYNLPQNSVTSFPSSSLNQNGLTLSGPFLLPKICGNSHVSWNDLTREQKLQLREGIFMQIAIGLTLNVLICKLPHYFIEVHKLCFPSIPHQSFQWLILYLIGELMSLLSIIIKPLLYTFLAPMVRQTLCDMLSLAIHPHKCHTISLSGGMGKSINIPYSKITQSNSHGNSHIGSYSSLSQMKRNNTVVSLIHNPIRQYPIIFPESVEENVKKYLLIKQEPFLFGKECGSESIENGYGSHYSYSQSEGRRTNTASNSSSESQM